MTTNTKPIHYIITVFLIQVTILFLSTFCWASEWQSIGYGTLNSVRFDVYIDSNSIQRVGGQVRFWQGHVFYGEQRLPSGEGYIRVSIEREGDCSKKTATNLRAIFYARDGSVVYNYLGDGVGTTPASPDTINIKTLEFACRYSKSNIEGISR